MKITKFKTFPYAIVLNLKRFRSETFLLLAIFPIVPLLDHLDFEEYEEEEDEEE